MTVGFLGEIDRERRSVGSDLITVAPPGRVFDGGCSLDFGFPASCGLGLMVYSTVRDSKSIASRGRWVGFDC